MSNNSDSENTVISEREAFQLAQVLNMLFTNATLYGGKHPLTQQGSLNLFNCLQTVFKSVPMVTLLRMGDSLYVEKWCVDNKMSVARHINYFQRVGIESISFENGVVVEDMQKFVRIVTDYQTYPSAEIMNNELKSQGIIKILLNYVFYKKVTKDDAVVTKESITREMPVPDASQKIAGEISKLFSLKELVDNPTFMASSILSGAGEDPDATAYIINKLKDIDNTITSRPRDSSMSLDDVMESVFTLSEELKQGLALQQETSKLFGRKDKIIDHVNALTYHVIIQLVKEEYRSNKISVKRLSQIIRRVLPDIKDLKKLLPMLKDALLAEGMPLADFLQLTKELNKEFENDNLIEILEEASQHIGLSVDEIVSAISENPDETARLIVLAAEIRKETKSDHGKIAELLSDYIESVSSKMALEAQKDNDDGSMPVLDDIIREIESQLMEKIKKQGVSDAIADEVEQQLAKRFPKTLKKLKTEWVVNIIASEEDLHHVELAKFLNTVVEKSSDLNELKEPIQNVLSKRGYDQEKIDAVFSEVGANFSKKSKKSAVLPKSVLNNSNTKFFLQRLIKENIRYMNPFSCILLSVEAICEAGIWKKPSDDEGTHVLSSICTILKGTIRELDLVGFLGRFDSTTLVIILPMTNESGAEVVKKRLINKFSGLVFTFDSRSIKASVAVLAAPFNKETVKDYDAYKNLMKTALKKERKKAETR